MQTLANLLFFADNPSISDYVAEFNAIDSDIRLILEPGRSLIANCAILVADVIGVKGSGLNQI